jgi:hypothetical protein
MSPVYICAALCWKESVSVLCWLADLVSDGCAVLLTVSLMPTMVSVARMNPHGWWGSVLHACAMLEM